MAPSTSPADNIYPYPSMLNIANFVTIKLSHDSSNYSLWKVQMLCLLESQELVGFIDGTIKPPSETVIITDHDDSLSSTYGREEMANQDFMKWKRSDRLVKGWILGSLMEEMLQKVADKVSARDVWLELVKVCCTEYQNKSQEAGRIIQSTVEEGKCMKPEEDYKYYLPLYGASLCGDWEEAEAFLDKDEKASVTQITSLLQTALHIAVGVKNDNAKSFVMNLMDSMTDDALAIRDYFGETPLHYAARFGNLDAAKILVKRNSNLPHIASKDGLYPIHLAAEYAYKYVKLVNFVFSVTTDLAPFTDRTGIRLLYRLICSDLYDLAMALIEKCPDLARYHSNELYPLALLATKASVFVGGSRLNSRKRASFRQTRSTSMISQSSFDLNDIENAFKKPQPDKPRPNLTKKLISSYYVSANIIRKYVPKSKKNREKEWKHKNAVKLAECLCEKLECLREDEIKKIVGGPLLQAARCDNYKLVEIIVGRFPSSVYYCNETKKNILHIAVENRCVNVFKLVYEMSEHRHHLMASIDSSNNTMLHLAGKLSPENKLNGTFGVALQMQRELQWFEEVKRWVPPSYYERLNNEGKKAHQIFTEEHADLKKEGQRWMKDTATSCTIVAALVAAIAFASAVQVPGGNDGDNGLPLLQNNRAFIVFFFSNAISLFASCNSLLGFLSILTSRYAEEDFLYKLPESLMGGLIDMFISIISMIISFCATLYLMSTGVKGWISSIILGIFAIRLSLYLQSQVPLLDALRLSTHRMLGKQDKALL